MASILTKEDIAALSGGSSKKKKKWQPPFSPSTIHPYDKVYNPWTGAQTTWAELYKFIEKKKKDRAWVRQVQTDIGMPFDRVQPKDRRGRSLYDIPVHSGKWGQKTDFYFKEWLLRQTKDYEKALKEAQGRAKDISYLPNLRDPSHPIAVSSEQAAIENAIRQGREQRKAIQEDMFRTWKDISGVTASEANVNWATEKVLQGWGYDDFYFWMKDRPEMKKMYPGMPNGMLPSEYTDVARSLNLKYMQTVGRPLKRHEIANLIKGGDFPEDDFFLGQPAIRDEEIR